MASVIHRTTLQYIEAVNTPDYDPAVWIISPVWTPDQDTVFANPLCYWQINGDDTVSIKSDNDKVIADAEYLPTVRAHKFNEIDARTETLIELGFTFSAKIFSLSSNAQKYWIGMAVGKDLLTYPLVVNTLNDLDTYSVTDATTVVQMYATAMGTVKYHLGTGTTLKDQVRAATTIAEVNAVVDTR